MMLEKIKVIDSPKLFHLAGEKGWYSQCGHEVIVKGFRFSVIPQPTNIKVSEVTTGMLLFKEPLRLEHIEITETKKGMLHLIKTVIAPKISTIINQDKNLSNTIKESEKKVQSKLGKRPKTITFSGLEEMKEFIRGGKIH